MDTRDYSKVNLFKLAAKQRKRKPNKTVRKYVDNKMRQIGERKYIWHTTGGTPINPIYSSTNMTQAYSCIKGTGENERVGEKIQPTSIEVRYSAYRGNADSLLRFLVVRVLDVTAGYTTNDVLSATHVNSLNYITAPYQLGRASRKKFQVLHDETVLLDDAKQNNVHRHFYVKVAKKSSVVYNSTGTNEAGQIYFGWISDNALATAPSLTYDIVARYRDL